MLNEAGHFIEDCILVPHRAQFVDDRARQRSRSRDPGRAMSLGRNVALIVDDDLHDLSLQGPVAVDFLARHVPGIRDLRNTFIIVPTTLFGTAGTDFAHRPTPASEATRLFCKGEDAGLIWDTILSEGQSMGITCRPAFTTLDYLRVESSPPVLSLRHVPDVSIPEHEPGRRQSVGAGTGLHREPPARATFAWRRGARTPARASERFKIFGAASGR